MTQPVEIIPERTYENVDVVRDGMVIRSSICYVIFLRRDRLPIGIKISIIETITSGHFGVAVSWI